MRILGSFPSKLRGLTGGLGAGIAIMTPAERRRACLLVVTAIIHGLIQTAVLLGVVGMLQWVANPARNLPQWAENYIRLWFGTADRTTVTVVLGGALLLLVLIKTAFGWAQSGWMSGFSASCENRLSALLMRRVLFARYSWLVQQNSSRLRQLLFGFVSVWSRHFIRTLMRLMNDAIMTVFIVSALIVSQPAAGLVFAFGGLAITSTLFLLVRPELHRLAETKRLGILGAMRISSDCILGVKDVKMASAETRFSQLFENEVRLYANADAKAQQWIQLPRQLLELIVYLALVGSGLYIVLVQKQNTDITGVLLLYGLAALRLLPVLSSNVSSVSTLVNAFPVISDLTGLIKETSLSEDISDAREDFANWHEVRIENASLRYEGSDRSALQNVTAVVRRGGMYGCVGRSGAGKSTFIDILSGLLDPGEGALLIDDKPLPHDKLRSWRKRLAYVAQRPFLLDESLRQNIVFEGDGFDAARLDRVIHLARLDEVVARLPGGLDARMGEQGGLLSGGERQRVAIARALYRGAELIVLDEATSSLDVLVEREIAATLERLRGEVTIIIVSHRLSLVRDADEIWVFDAGMITARGNHAALMRNSGLYRQMVQHGMPAEAT